MRAALLACLLAAPLVAHAAPSLPLDVAPPFDHGLRERVFVTASSAGVASWGAFDSVRRTYADLDGDGAAEIVAQNDDGRTFVFDANGRVLGSVRVPRDAGVRVRDMNGVAVADLDANGRVELVVPTATGRVAAFEAIASPGLRFEERWSVALLPMDGPPALGDVDGDGAFEVFLQADGQAGHYALDARGRRLWTSNLSDGNAGPRVVDLDGDGRLEAIFATDGGRVYVYDAASGARRWDRRIPASPGSVPVAPAIVDLDGDGRREIVVAARNVATGEEWIERSHAVVAAFDATGRLRWPFTADWMNPLVGSEAAVADLDGDGRPELVYVDWNTPGHKPGAWERIPTANAFALRGDGSLLWRHSFEAYWSNRGPLVVDLDADGAPEVVVVAEDGERSGLLVLARDGARKAFVSLPAGWKANRGAESADLDGDGLAELVVPVAREATGCAWPACREGALVVLDTRARAPPPEPRPPVGAAVLPPATEHPDPKPLPPEDRDQPPLPGPPVDPRLSGRATGTDGRAVAVHLRVESPGELRLADADEGGRFAVRVPPALLAVTFLAVGFEPGSISLDFSDGKSREVPILLVPQGVVRHAPGFAALGVLAAAAAAVGRRP